MRGAKRWPATDHNEKKTFHASAKSFYLSSTELIKQEGVTFYWDIAKMFNWISLLYFTLEV